MLLFQPPQPPEPWTDVLDTSDLGYVCMQGEYTQPIWDMYENNEDCLNMNIYSKQVWPTQLYLARCQGDLAFILNLPVPSKYFVFQSMTSYYIVIQCS